ncbi:MAG TPA: glycosyltransferase family 2 protein [Candidatus Deferrimicrobium sp.]|nr:glycosyltransferase family 2 protein [Candidatus Deferrimicrobium sp.]
MAQELKSVIFWDDVGYWLHRGIYHPLKFDFVIISKDKPVQLKDQIRNILAKTYYNNIIVVDSSEKISPSLLTLQSSFNEIVIIHTPNAKLGYARQRGLMEVKTDYFFMIDDDIIFKKGFDVECYNAIKGAEENVFALSPLIIFGNDPLIKGIFERRKLKKDREGTSGGICIINKEIIKEIGGYNKNIHIGEDAELFSRAKVLGYRWIRKMNICVYHPLSRKDFIFRTWNHRHGFYVLLAYNVKSRKSLLFDRSKEFILSVIRFFTMKNKLSEIYFISHNLVSLITIVRVFIGGEKYALFKTKIEKKIN